MEKMTTEQLLENAKMGMEDFSEDFTKSKDRKLSLAITEDYFDYELHRIEMDMQNLIFRVARFSKALEQQRHENLSVVDRLLKENKELRDWKKQNDQGSV